jgi:hypothetical protein
MNTHVRVVAFLHIFFGTLTLLSAVVVFLSFGLAGGLAFINGEPGAAGILGIICMGVCGLLSVLALPDLIGGWALLTGRSWGKTLVLVLGVLHLFNIPIGTALGIYTLWALLRMEDEIPYKQRLA